MERIHIKPGETQVRSDGSVARASKARFSVPTEGTSSLTDDHEMTHVYPILRRNGSFDEVTNIAEGNSLGHVKVTSAFDPVAVVAPWAMGLPGGGSKDSPGSDIAQLYANGYTPDSVSGEARRLCTEGKTHIRALAIALNKNRTMNQSGSERIVNAIDEGADMEVVVEKAGKIKKGKKTGIKDTEVSVPIEVAPVL